METKRLIIEKISMDYLDDINEYSTDPSNCKYMLFLPNDSINDTIGFIKESVEEWNKDKPNDYVFILILDNKAIGTMSITPLDDGSMELGWIISKKYQNQGYAYEGASCIIKYGIEELGVKHFIAHCDKDNIPSWHLMEKLGMERVKEYGGRFNKLSNEEKIELLYELNVK